MAQGSVVASTLVDDENYDDPDLPEGEDEFLEPIEDEELPADPEAERLAAIEAEARRGGWRPLNEYRGQPGKWIDAETFIRRGKEYLPFVQKDLRDTKETLSRVEAENAQMRATLAEQGVVLQELRQFARNADQAGYNRAMNELRAKQRAAVSEGDTQAFDEVQEQIDQLVEGRAERGVREREAPPPATPEPPPQPRPQGQIAPEVQAFIAANPWFNMDRVLNAAMIEEHVRLQKEEPGLPLDENLEKAKEFVMAQFPKKFGRQEEPPAEPRPAAPRARTVMPPRMQQHGGGAVRDPFEAITDPAERAEVKKAYARMKRNVPEMTAKEYVTLYQNPRADVLSMRHAKEKR